MAEQGIILGSNGKPLAVRAHYDVVTKPRNPSGGRKRRQARIERGEEEALLAPRHRLQATTLVRDAIRNTPQARGIAKTMRVNVVGSYGKLQFKETGDFYSEAARWFNSVWARAIDFLDNTSWRESLQLVVYAIAHEGDFVAVFDDGTLSARPGGTGKMVFFEADHICNLRAIDFSKFEARGYTQDAGVISDRLGRQVGVILSRKRGETECALDGAIVLSRDPDVAQYDLPWVHVRRKFRLRQKRAAGDALTSLRTLLDSDEILGYELQTAKSAAARYATVIESEEDDPLTPSGYDDLESEQNGDGDEESRVEALEHYTGGNVDYVPSGTDIKFDPTTRPNVNLGPFLDYTTDVAGASFGLAHAYARMKADTSYTAFRGDMTMTWMTFKDFQQFLEDSFSDWAAVQAVRWGMKRGAIKAAPPEGWEGYIAWQYPRMPAVDEAKEQTAIAQKLKNGLTTFAEEIGPHWREHFETLGAEIKFAKSLGIPLSILETVAGAMASSENNNDGED